MRPYTLETSYLRSGDTVPRDRHVLLAMGFGKHTPALAGAISCAVDFSVYDSGGWELWTSDRPVQRAREGQLELAWDGQTLMGMVAFEDSQDRLTKDTQYAYDQIFNACERHGYPHLSRMWNFIPQINGTDAYGMERYRSFCSGRAQAFFDDRHYGEMFLPAGTGVGCNAGPVTIIFLARAEGAALNLENPRQMPAYHYPRQYGPKSPSFARATLVPDQPPMVYVSGTSSILGHETVHAGDIDRQTQISLENIAYLISLENLARYGQNRWATLQDLDQIKVYVRHPEHLEAVRAQCSRVFAPTAQTVYLGADICRADLLVEIEAVARLRSM